jgi:hypothetical protein
MCRTRVLPTCMRSTRKLLTRKLLTRKVMTRR